MSQPIKLPKLLQEGCVLQRGEKTRIWGWYKPQAELEVTFQEKVYRTKCDAEGTFETEISCEKGDSRKRGLCGRCICLLWTV